MIARLIDRMLASFLPHRNYASQVPCYFCSTPESSAQVAKLGHIFSAVPLLKEMCSGNDNDLAAESRSCERSAHGRGERSYRRSGGYHYMRGCSVTRGLRFP